MEQVFQQKLAETNDPEKRRTLRRMQLAGVWGHWFRTPRGDEVYLVVPASSDIALISNAPAGAKWLVTKPVQINGRPFCWSVAFEAVPGEEVEIALAEGNLLDLDALDRRAQP